MNLGHFGRYVIREKLGQGGMATVYRAWDPRFDREVAVKVLPIELLHDPSFYARFEREAKLIAALEHPAIVPVHDFGEEAGQPYLVMRYMPGGSLADRIHQKGPLPTAEAAAILQRIGSALDRAHSRGIIHRDIKPGNILFDQYGDAFLADFGIARLESVTMSLTGSGVVGTPAYMSPEQARGQVKLDGRSDIYALGVILFEMLTGQMPYKADTPMAMFIQHAFDPIPRAQDLKKDLPPACQVVIERAMAKERDGRFPTGSALAAAAATLASAGAAHSPLTPKVAPPPSPGLQPTTATLPRRETRLPIGMLAAVAGGLLVIILLCFAGASLLPAVFDGADEETSTPTQAAPLPSSQPPTLTATATDTPTRLPSATPTRTKPAATAPSPTATPALSATPALIPTLQPTWTPTRIPPTPTRTPTPTPTATTPPPTEEPAPPTATEPPPATEAPPPPATEPPPPTPE